MGTLHLALEEGFTGDDVVVRVNGDEVFRKRVQTRWQISLADSFDLELRDGRFRVEVEVPSRAAATALDVDVTEEVWVGVSVDADNDLKPRVSGKPFGYV